MGDSISRILKLDTTDACFLDVKVGPDSAYYAAGYQRDTTDSYQDMLMHKYSKYHQLLWDEDVVRAGQEARYNALQFKGNNIMALGKGTKYGGEGDNLFINYLQSTSGVWLGGVGVGQDGDEYIYSVNIDTSNTNTFYLLTGTTTSYNMLHSGVYFIRMNDSLKFDAAVVVDMPSSISKANNLDVDIIYSKSCI